MITFTLSENVVIGLIVALSLCFVATLIYLGNR